MNLIRKCTKYNIERLWEKEVSIKPVHQVLNFTIDELFSISIFRIKP